MKNYCLECKKPVSRNAKRCNSCNAKRRIVSEETKSRLRIANLGKKASNETRKKLSDSLKGHKISKETVRKIRETRLKNNSFGCSEETKKKISETKKRLYSEGKIEKYWEGKHLSQEHKDKVSKGNKGKKLSEETKQKMMGRKVWNKDLKGWTKNYKNAGFQKDNKIQFGEKTHNWKGRK